MLAITVTVTGPDHDVHSGNDGGVFNEPMVDLVKVCLFLALHMPMPSK